MTEITPHEYSPSLMHMGDCSVCGNVRDAAYHVAPDLPVRALSIRQPWATAIIEGHKTVENRKRRTSIRGPVCIHAAKRTDYDAFHQFLRDQKRGYPFKGISYLGMIIGVAEIIDVIDQSDDPWFFGPYGYVLKNARPVPPIAVRGMLGFFDWRKQLTDDQITGNI